MKHFKKFWSKWKKISHVMGSFQIQVLFTLFYFLIMFPVGFKIRFFSDFLNIKKAKKSSSFTDWIHPEEDIISARKPY